MGVRRFSIWDLAVGIFCGICVVALFFPTVHHTHEVTYFLRCAVNLRQIGQGLTAYAQDNHQSLPRTRYDPDLNQWNSFTNPEGSGPFTVDGPRPNDVTASLYLLIRGKYTPPEAFRCPATEYGSMMQPEDATAASRTNFSTPTLLGYSIANPYPNADAEKAGYRWDTTLSPDFALAADINPGTIALSVGTTSSAIQMKATQTPNHRYASSENVLYSDGHVESTQTPFAGVDRDNIYTYGTSAPTTGGAGVVGSPTSANDSVLLPVASIDVRPINYHSASEWPAKIVMSVVAILVAVGLVALRRFVFQRRRV